MPNHFLGMALKNHIHDILTGCYQQALELTMQRVLFLCDQMVPLSVLCLATKFRYACSQESEMVIAGLHAEAERVLTTAGCATASVDGSS